MLRPIAELRIPTGTIQFQLKNTMNSNNSIYTRIYNNLVNSRKELKEQWKPTGSGLERHHIIPTHSGGINEEANYTYLTRREHTIAHWLLWKIHGDKNDLLAYRLMGGFMSANHFLHSEETKRKRLSKRMHFHN